MLLAFMPSYSDPAEKWEADIGLKIIPTIRADPIRLLVECRSDRHPSYRSLSLAMCLPAAVNFRIRTVVLYEK